MLVRRERVGDAGAIAAVTEAAFADTVPAGQVPVEVGLVDLLRASDEWLPALSLVAVGGDGRVIGHVVCTRAHLGGEPVLGLGPLSVHPDHQRRGVGSALVHAVLGAADALDEPLIVLLGSPWYYRRFGFELAEGYGIEPPVAEWVPHFQVRPLGAYTAALRGEFAYARPFMEL